MSRSILTDLPVCFICGDTRHLQRHHIYGNHANRKLSEREGCWVYLCAWHHTMGNNSVHQNREMDLRLKRMCEKRWIEENGTEEDFRKIFGKSWLTEEDEE